MHGAASPYAWPGLSQYDMYQQAAQSLQPPTVLPRLPAQSHIPHVPSVMNARLPAPWINPDLQSPVATDAYLHKLGVNGYQAKPCHSATDSSLASLPSFHVSSERNKSIGDLYFSTSNVYKHQTFGSSHSLDEKVISSYSGALQGASNIGIEDVSSPGFSHSVRNELPHTQMKDISSSFLPSLPTCSVEAADHLSSHSNDSYTHLKWKNAYLPPQTSSKSLCVSSHMSTSTEFMPVTTTAASQSVIPYKPREYDTYSVPNGAFKEAATKEAARILEEASMSNKKIDDRIPISSFADRIPASTFKDRIPASSFTDWIPSSTFTDRIPASSFTDGIPTSTFTDWTPASTFTDRIPMSTFTDRIPTSTFTDRIPTSTFTDRIPTSTFTDRIPTSTFTDISNIERQQTSTSVPQSSSSHKPSIRSLHNIHHESPLDFRPENQIHVATQHHTEQTQVGSASLPPKEPAGQRQLAGPIWRQSNELVQGDFWSEFGIPPPNVALDQKPTSKRNGSFLSHSDDHVKANKKFKKDDTGEEAESDTCVVESFGKERIEENKRSEKLTRRKSFTEDPAMDALVDAKVQEIMAACKEKEQQQLKTEIEKPKVTKSPKHSNHTSGLLYWTQPSVPGKHAEHIPCHQNFQHNYKKSAKESVYDFNESDDHLNLQKKDSFPQKDLPQQVMDMRMYKKQKHASGESSSYQVSDHKSDSKALCEQISGMRTKSKFTPTNLGDGNIEQSRHVMSLSEQINEIQYSKNTLTPHVFKIDKNLTVEGYKSDVSNKNSENVLYKKENKNEIEDFGGKCCLDCNKLGKSFSENCQNNQHKYHVNGKLKEDPFQFSDQSSSIGPYNRVFDNIKQNSSFNRVNTYSNWNKEYLKTEHEKFVNSYKMVSHSEKMSLGPKSYGDIKHNVQYISENKKGLNMHSVDKSNVFYKRGFKTEKASQKFKPVSLKLDRPQGQISATKKFSSKPYALKSSLALLKKSQKFHHVKLPSIRKKWRNNPKYKKVTKDDFEEKLIKNLGFPPLTLKDLVTKRHCRLPKGYINGHSTIAASMLSAEDKAARRGTLPAADISLSHVATSGCSSLARTVDVKTLHPEVVPLTSTHSQERKSTEAKVKVFQRSKSADFQAGRSDNENNSVHRSRSWSFDDLRKESESCLSNDKERDNMKAVSDQIQDLHAKVTGREGHLESNTVIDMPKCDCLGIDGIYSEAVEGPYYTHLGSGRSVEAIRKTLEQRTGQMGKAIRIEKVRYTGKEGKSKQGCPIAKWIVRRSGIEEKYLALVRHRVNHTCETAWLIIGLVAWEGVPATQADDLYDFLSTTLPPYGNETERRCGTNERKTCACQGADLMKRGASFSFGCSWSMYFNGCKFARSAHVRKFRLKNEDKESILESKLQGLASQVAPLYEKCAPEAHANQCYYSEKAPDCRLGEKAAGPFSGVTACVDFCAHAHKDIHNMNNGSTVVVTLTKHRGLSKPDDEQLHVLPLYVLEPTDEDGSYEGQYEKIRSGSLEVLHQFPLEARMRAHPLESCKKRRMSKKGRGGLRQAFSGRLSPWDSSSSTQSTPKKENILSQDWNQSTPSLSGLNSNTPVKQHTTKFDINSDKPISYDDLMAVSTQAGFNELYNKFWDYFYAFGVFPPPSILAASLQGSSSVWNKPQEAMNHKLNNTRQQNNIGQVNAVPGGADCSVPSQTVISQDQSNPASHHGSSVQVGNPFKDSPFQQYSRLPPSYGDVPDQNQVQSKKEMISGMQTKNHTEFEKGNRATGSEVSAHMETPKQPLLENENNSMKKGQVVTSQPAIEQTTGENISAHFSSDLQSDSGVLDLSFSASFGKQDMSADKSTPVLQRNPSVQENSNRLPNLNGVNNAESTKKTDDEVGKSPLDLLTQAVDRHSGYTGSVPCVNSSTPSTELSSLRHAGTSLDPVTNIGRDNNNHSNVTRQYTKQTYCQFEQKQSSLPEYDTYCNKESYSVSTSDNLKQTHSSGADLPNKNGEQRSSQSGKDFNFPSQYLNGPNDISSQKQHEGMRMTPGNQYELVGMTPGNQYWKSYDPQKLTCHEKLDTVNKDHFSSCEEPSLLDPDVVKCEMEYNEEAFLDPNIGGVAVALCHGAVLFEVAKRELHATTGLKNPNRYHPTRISLVFYQHKNLNAEKHGMYVYEKKLEDLKMKRIEKMQLERGYVDMKEIENSFKGGKKRKMTDEEEEIVKLVQSAKGEYRYMWNCNTKRSDSTTTETLSTKWIDPSPMVTGPYQKWV